MAVRFRKDRNKWEAYFRDPVTGNRRGKLFATEEEAKKEDRRIKYLLEFDPAALGNKQKFVAEAMYKQVATEYCQLYGISGKALQRACTGLRKFGRFFGAECKMSDITDVVLVKYRDSMIMDGLKIGSVIRYIDWLMSLLHFAKEHGYIFEVPKRPSLPTIEIQEFVPPTIEEVWKLYMVAKQEHIRRMIILGACFGMRVGPCEMFSLRWSDIDLKNWVIRLRAAKKNHRETIRVLPIVGKFRDMFLAWYAMDKQYGQLGTVINYKGKQISECLHSWKSLLKQTGMHFRPYDLRHAFATNAIVKGNDIVTVARLMGHANINMVSKYYRYVSNKDKEGVLESLYDRVV